MADGPACCKRRYRAGPCSTSGSTGRPSSPPCSPSSSSPSRSRDGRRPCARARSRTRSTRAAPTGASGSRGSLLQLGSAFPRARPGLRRATTRWPIASPRRCAARGSTSTAARRAGGPSTASATSRPWSASARGCRTGGSSSSPTATRPTARASPSCPAPRRCSSWRGSSARATPAPRPRPSGAPTTGRGSSGATCARRWCWCRPRAGAAAPPERAPGRARRIPRMIDGVLVLGDLASREWHKPWVVPWSNGRDNPPIALERTVEAAARQETGTDPGGSRASAQWSRRALPLTVSEQGEVNRARTARRAAADQRRARPGAERAGLARAVHPDGPQRAALGAGARRGGPRRRAAPRSRTRRTGSSPRATCCRRGACA